MPSGADAVWRSDFSGGKKGLWRPYGEGTSLAIVMDAEQNQNVLEATFRNAGSAVPSMGMHVKIDDGISWEDFQYLSFRYKVHPSAGMIGCLMRDTQGNWWKAVRGDPGNVNEWQAILVNAWADLAFNKSSFVFQWNDDKTVTNGKKDAKIVELYIFAGAPPSKAEGPFRLLLSDIAFVVTLPEEETPFLSLPDDKVEEARMEDFTLQWKVSSLNARGNIVVDGKPFFPLGLYSCFGIDQASATHAESAYSGEVTEETTMAKLREMKEAGFNMLQTYTMQFYGTKVSGPGWKQSDPVAIIENTTPERVREGMLRFMDSAGAAGLKVMIGANQPYSCMDEILPTAPKARARVLDLWKAQTKVNVEAYKNHPALLAWKLIDEPSQMKPNGMPVEDLAEYYRFCKTLDTVHPMFLPTCGYVHYSHGSDRKYRKAVDIMGPDPYPIVSDMRVRTLGAVLDLMKKDQTGSPAMPQLWAVIQICQWVEGRRLPSIEEMRVLSLLALTKDVKGLMFYAYKNYPDREPEHWKKISLVVNSLHTLFPDLLAPSEILTDYKVSSQKIDSILRKVTGVEGGNSYYSLIAVNASQNAALEPENAGIVTFDLGNIVLPEGSKIIALDEDQDGKLSLGSRREIALENKDGRANFSDQFGVFASHAYRIGLAHD